MTKEELVIVRRLFEVLDVASFNGLNARKMSDLALKMQAASKALADIEKRIIEKEKLDKALATAKTTEAPK